MVHIQAIKRLGQLRQILLVGAVATSSTCFDALLSFQSAVNEQNFQRGRQYVSTSGNGQHASYAMVGSGAQWTQENVFAMSEEFFSILADTLAANPTLVDDGSKGSQLAIFNAMAADDRLQTVNRRGMDSTLLGFPQVGQLGGPA